MSVDPLWACAPWTRNPNLCAAHVASTSPIVTPSSSMLRPCWTWISAYEAISGAVKSPRSPIASSASATVTPCGSVVASAASRSALPVKTLPVIIEGLNREPSSLNQLTTARLNRACEGSARSSSAIAKHACALAITPYAPSKRPAVGRESMCDPVRTYGAPGTNSSSPN